jgi:hypothetical protein
MQQVERSGELRSLPKEALESALNEGTLEVTGVRLWNALHSEAWRHREAAAQAYLDYLSDSSRLPLKHSKTPDNLLDATLTITKLALQDKLL